MCECISIINIRAQNVYKPYPNFTCNLSKSKKINSLLFSLKGWKNLFLVENIKACVCLFFVFTKWWPYKNYEKCFSFHLKSFFILKIFKFCIPPFPTFSSHQPLLEKMTEDKSKNLWLHQLAQQEFKKILFAILRKKVGLLLKLVNRLSIK